MMNASIVFFRQFIGARILDALEEKLEEKREGQYGFTMWSFQIKEV